MNKKVKALLLVLCAIVFFAAGIFATLAYLQDTTDTAVNTINVGDVQITMDEEKVDEYGDATGEGRIPNANIKDQNGNVIKGNKYTLIPGELYTKDPTIHVAENKESAYIFVRVVNPIVPVEDKATYIGADGTEKEGTIAQQMAEFGWVDAGYDNLFVYKVDGDTDTILEATLVDTKNGVAKDLPIFKAFQVLTTLDNEKVVVGTDTLDDFETKEIKIQAYAIQARNVTFDLAAQMANAALNLGVANTTPNAQ